MKDAARAIRMAHAWLNGSTLKEIGSEYGLTSERVRQILNKLGLKGEFGGARVRAFVSERYRKKDPLDRFMPNYGCTRREVIELNGGVVASTRGTTAFRYSEQRRNAVARGIEWNMTYPQWLKIWQDSGKLELRGRGQGYCMTRIGDTGAYEPDNVEIKTIGENFSEAYYKHPWHKRFGKQKAASQGGAA